MRVVAVESKHLARLPPPNGPQVLQRSSYPRVLRDTCCVRSTLLSQLVGNWLSLSLSLSRCLLKNHLPCKTVFNIDAELSLSLSLFESLSLFLLLLHARARVCVCVRVHNVSTVPVYMHLRVLVGFGCTSVGRASDRHAAEVGLVPRCGKGFFSQSQLSVLTLLRCPYTPVCNRMHLHLCAR